MKSTLPIQWLKSSVHYQPNLSFDLALQLMVYVRTRVHQVFANWWATSACIGYELVLVVYEIDDKDQQVLITRIRHRREVYR